MRAVERTPARRVARGTSLVEVLVAMVVSAIGLLGVVALQAGAVRSAKTAVVAGAATAAVEDVADRMRSNALAHDTPAGYSKTGTYDAWSGVRPAAVPCALAVCTAAEVVREDLSAWQRALASNLPEGAGFVLLDAPRVYRVVVAWRERASVVGAPASNGDCPAALQAPTDVRCLVASVRP